MFKNITRILILTAGLLATAATSKMPRSTLALPRAEASCAELKVKVNLFPKQGTSRFWVWHRARTGGTQMQPDTKDSRLLRGGNCVVRLHRASLEVDGKKIALSAAQPARTREFLDLEFPVVVRGTAWLELSYRAVSQPGAAVTTVRLPVPLKP